MTKSNWLLTRGARGRIEGVMEGCMLPRWLSWLFLLLMGYLMYMGTRGDALRVPSPQETPTPEHPQEIPVRTLADYPHLHQLTNANHWKRALNPAHVGDAKLVDARLGEGKLAQCGSAVTVHLRGTLNDGANFDPAHQEGESLHFRLGDAPYPVLNEALIGMREGGIRQITAPPQRVFTKVEPTLRGDVLLRVEMNAVVDAAPPANRLGFRAFQDREGSGDAAACGEPIALHWKLWNTKGDLAFETAKPVTVTLGKDALPPELTAGLSGMAAGEARTLIVPATASAVGATTIPAEIRKALGSGNVTLLSVERGEE